jgi:serine/threonine-protein phosphatase 6 regulatory ankyrin repeat subunit B
MSLIKSCLKGNLITIIDNIKRGSDINKGGKDNFTPLMWASMHGHLNIVELLTQKGAHLNTKNYNGNTALHLAAKFGHTDTVNFLIEQGAKYNDKNKYNNTPLQIAYEFGHFDIMKLFIEKKLFVDKIILDNEFIQYLIENNMLEFAYEAFKQNKFLNKYNSLLVLVVIQKNIEMVKMLLDLKIQLNGKDNKGKTAFMHAIITEQVEIINLLLNDSNGLTNTNFINEKDNDGLTPIMHAIKTGNLEIFNIVIKLNPNINEKDNDGFTPIIHAINTGNFEIANILIDLNANINEQDNNNKIALIHLMQFSFFDRTIQKSVLKLMTKLIEKGSILNEKDNNGQTILIHAIENRYNGLIGLLVQSNSINIDETDSEGKTALMHALNNGQYIIANLLIDSILNINTTINSSDTNNITVLSLIANCENKWMKIIVNKLLSKGFTIDQKDKIGGRLMTYVARFSTLENVLFLIENGSSINIKDNSGMTPLILALTSSNFDIAEYFIENGANIDEKDSSGTSALIHACGSDMYETIVGLLVNHGANLNEKNASGYTGLMYASARGYFNIVKMLVDGGVNIDDTNSSGTTALSFAKQYNNSKIVALLETVNLKRYFMDKKYSKIYEIKNITVKNLPNEKVNEICIVCDEPNANIKNTCCGKISFCEDCFVNYYFVNNRPKECAICRLSLDDTINICN